MNAKELMIGNWVKHAGGDYMQVTKLMENHYACSKNGVYLTEYVNPKYFIEII